MTVWLPDRVLRAAGRARVHAGKVLHIGSSTFPAEHIVEALARSVAAPPR